MATTTSADELREEVRRRYAETALRVSDSSSCCGNDACCAEGAAASFYDEDEQGELPEAAKLASLGCGNPIAVAELRAGETVLDLGSGGGLDVILSA